MDKVDTIIFDIDGTLSEEVSWLKITEKLGASVEKHAQIFNDFKLYKIKYEQAKKELLDLWKSTGQANKESFLQMFNNWPLREDAVDVLNSLSGKYKLCLISGAVDFYVETIAKRLNIKDWYANTTLVWNENNELVDFHYTLDQAALKLTHFNDFIKKNNINSDKCAVVGDGDSDLILFKELKYSVAVNKESYPDLEALATYKIDHLKDLMNIF